LAAALRERDSSAVTTIGPGRGALAFDEWQVQGMSHHEVQSLQRLERLLTRLRVAGLDHRSKLVSLAI
jgi:hypothetical protein